MHRWTIVAHAIPDAVIVDRSAASGGAPADGTLFVASSQRSRDLEVPGLTVSVRSGPRLDSDLAWASGLTIASPARTLVDNLAVSRGRGRIARTLSRDELGDWVARQARVGGDLRINELRDTAKEIARNAGVRFYARTLAFAWRWTAAMTWTDEPTTRVQLEQTNALVDSNEAAASGIRLRIP